MNYENQQSQSFHGNGKLLLTAEYAVLDGAVALALPCKLGQTLIVEKMNSDESIIHWVSYDEQQEIWFEATFSLDENFTISENTDIEITQRVQQVLTICRQLNPAFLSTKNDSFTVSTVLEFPRQWGLGTSSTLIYAVAKWANVNPYSLLSLTFGGSGYDIACAASQTPILYQNNQTDNPIVQHIAFKPPFKEQLYFVFLEKKQNSRQGIQHYREKDFDKNNLINAINDLTQRFLAAQNLEEFENLIAQHETLIASNLALQTAKNQYFDDFWGQIKSLGAWGGDFVLATSNHSFKETQTYFFQKGFSIFIPYQAMVL